MKSREISCKKLGVSLALIAVFVVAGLALGAVPASAADCASMANLNLKDTKIISATVIPADGKLPEYCKVLGSIHNYPQSTIQFEVSMPTTKWNGKYFVAGGGGYNGTIPRLNQALAEGYAAAGSDTGHEAKDTNWAVNNLDAQINYAYVATHIVTLMGKQILRVFYSQHEDKSYYVGCSNGGKMGLAEIQRFPDDFDAVVVGDPVIARSSLMMQYVWNGQALAAAPIPPAKIPVIEKATMNACRESGGAVNDVLITPGRCKFDPKVIMCPSGDGPNCLTAGQVKSLTKVMQGPVSTTGVQLHPGFVPGHEEDYSAFITGNGTDAGKPASSWALMDVFMRQFIFGMQFDPIKQFKFDADLAALKPLEESQDNADPDLSAFRDHGGKLIMYHGWADHSITPLRTLEYYEDVLDTMDKEHTSQSEPNAYALTNFVRLFMVPGMHHCSGGPGPNVFGAANQGLPPQMDAQHDIVMALDRWAEDGVAPEKIIATHLTNGTADRTLPLCPYPQVQVYNGTGDANLAENYHCVDHAFHWAIDGVMPSKKPAAPMVAAKKKPVEQSMK